MVPDSSSSTNSFVASVRPLPVDPLPDGRRHPSLFVSVVSLPSSVSPLPLSVVSPPLLASAVPSPVSSSLPPSPLFLLSAPPVVVPLPPRAWPLLPLFILQAAARIFHHRNPTSGQY